MPQLSRFIGPTFHFLAALANTIMGLILLSVLRLRHVRIEPSSFGLHPKIDEGTSVSPLRAHEIALEARKRLNAEGYLDARVDSSLLPVSKRAADVQLTIRAGKPVEVRSVEFAGHTGLDVKELRSALRDL